MFDGFRKKKQEQVKPQEVVPGPDMNKCLGMYDQIMEILCKEPTTTLLEWDVTMSLVAQQILQQKSAVAIHTEISKITMLPVPVPVHMEEEAPPINKTIHQHYN